MRAIAALIGSAALAGCSAAPLNCQAVLKRGASCALQQRGTLERGTLLACFPFSKPQRIIGSWRSGFETNEFYDGKAFSTGQWPGGTSTTSQTELFIGENGDYSAYDGFFRVDLMGRRSVCGMGLGRDIIVVDRLIAERRVSGP
jgi:hypothetical protein